jgi:hypothetical protein
MAECLGDVPKKYLLFICKPSAHSARISVKEGKIYKYQRTNNFKNTSPKHPTMTSNTIFAICN